ncbi:thiamine diphosphokinase [Rhodobacteraceae bacterium KMM 6894]|nr:thiamine diphosphokinase [Rhodobacteraceae bacterium KMM 6894]
MIVQTSGSITLIGGANVAANLFQMAISRAPRVVAADGGADSALAYGVLPEAVIGDGDSISAATRAALPPDHMYQILEQDSTDFEKCLARIDAGLILGVGFSGARLDHQLAVCNALVRAPQQRCVLLGSDDLVFLAPPAITLDMPEGVPVSLFPMGAVEGHSEGLKWPIRGLSMVPDGQIGTSNMALGSVDLSVTAPKMLVIVPLAQLDVIIDGLSSAAARW